MNMSPRKKQPPATAAKKGESSFWDRHDTNLKRFGLLFGIATGLVSLLALGLKLSADDAPATGADSYLSADEQRLIDSISPLIGVRCRPAEPEYRPLRVSPAMVSLTSAGAVCAPFRKGPSALHFYAFTTAAEMDRYMRDQHYEVGAPTGACSGGGGGQTPWVDSAGRLRGQLVCDTSATSSDVFWSDSRELYVGAAEAAPDKSSSLFSWWQEAVRFEDSGPDPAAERRLRSLLPDSFGSCEMLTRMPAVATAGLGCKPGRGIWSAGASLIPDADMLADYIEGRAAAITDLSDKGCRDSTRSFTVYGPGADARPVRGRLLCHAEDGQQWFEWTATRPRVYAYLSRTDESLSKLFQQWSNSLSVIKGMTTPN